MPFPGVTARKTTAPGPKFLITPIELAPIVHFTVKSTAVDAGNSAKTTTLRAGLVVAELTATPGEIMEYDPAQTDGRQFPIGFLGESKDLTAETGTVQDTPAPVVMGGIVDPDSIYGLDANARDFLRDRFVFKDQWNGPSGDNFRLVEVKTANYTIVAADRGKLFSTRGASGAVVFTLPALSAVGRNFYVGVLVEADQNVTVQRAGADTIVAPNNLAAVSVAYQTASQKIGGRLEVRVNDNKTKFFVEKCDPHTLTVA